MKKTKKMSLFLALVMTGLILLSGCGSKASGSFATDGNFAPAPSAEPVPMPMEPEMGYEKPSMDSSSGGSGELIYNGDQNKIIRTASMEIQTTEFDKAVKALSELTAQCGGYFESANVYGGSYYSQNARRSANYVVRIPTERFEAFRDSTGTVGHVYSLSENNQDVGEAYYDTEARLSTLEIKRERLQALLEKADKMEDIIMLESELSDLQYQIDMYTGTLRRYDSLIGFSTFHITLDEVLVLKDEPGVTESFGSRLLSDLKRGFADFGEGVKDFVLWLARNLIGVVIFVAAVVVIVVMICRRVKRRKAKKSRENPENKEG
ncbi:MAG: DUF4349 domain-containing protein [Oscillospiraceae bacterium]|nr:DUF4349 domain-containing protein [Oscillospiraceae bacterium]